MLQSGMLFADRFVWFTPSWLVGVGVTLGLVALFALLGVLWLIKRPAARWCWEVATEGVLLPLLLLGGLISLFSVGILLVGLFNESKSFPIAMFGRSLSRLFIQQAPELSLELKPGAKDVEVIFDDILPTEIETIELTATEDASFKRYLKGMPGYSILDADLILKPKQTWSWSRSIKKDKNDPLVGKYFFTGEKARFYITNNTNLPNKLTAKVYANVEFPQVSIILTTAIIIVCCVLAYYLLRFLAPRMIAVASTTMKETLYQPLFYLLLVFLIGVIFIMLFIPQNTFGVDIKPYKYNNLTLFTWVPVFLVIWTASYSIAEEIEGRTAVTVLSKPIGRIQFILGKYLGVMFPVVLLYCMAGAFFLTMIPFKVVYDAREGAELAPTWEICFDEMRLILPGLALTFMECMVLAAISVAISTRLPMLANLLIMFAIYMIGHVLPLLVQSSRLNDPYRILEFSARFFAAIFPVLENYKIDAAIVEGKEVPWEYLGTAMGYTGVYCAFALLLSLLLFETRDVS